MSKATLIEQVTQFLLTAEETGISISLLKRHNQLVGEKGVSDSELTTLHQSGLYTDVLEAAERGTLNEVDRTVFRHVLGLQPTVDESHPTITITGEEELELPDWVKKVERDTTEPTGTLELEFIRLLEDGERSISSEEMISRAENRGADLGLRHAQAFLDKYSTEGFGLPAGTYIPFPGTVVVDRDGCRRPPFLRWGGDRWALRWRWLERGWRSSGRLARPRAYRLLDPLTL